MSDTAVKMTTKLEGAATRFLPFNKGYKGGAGNVTAVPGIPDAPIHSVPESAILPPTCAKKGLLRWVRLSWRPVRRARTRNHEPLSRSGWRLWHCSSEQGLKRGQPALERRAADLRKSHRRERK